MVQIFGCEIGYGQSSKQNLIAKIIRRIKKSYFQVVDYYNFYIILLPKISRKKYKRVHILRRINRFKFYSRASFIGSDTLQSLKMDLGSAKDMDSAEITACANHLYVNMRVDLFKVYVLSKELKKSTNKIFSFFFEK